MPCDSESDGPRPPLRPAILSAHAGLDGGFIQEDEAAGISLDRQLERSASGAVCVRLALYGGELLFFREKPRRRRARLIDERLSFTDSLCANASASSAWVMSGCSLMIATNVSATDPRMGDRFPPPRGFGTTPPVSRWRLRTRLTVASPTLNNAAIWA